MRSALSACACVRMLVWGSAMSGRSTRTLRDGGTVWQLSHSLTADTAEPVELTLSLSLCRRVSPFVSAFLPPYA